MKRKPKHHQQHILQAFKRSKKLSNMFQNTLCLETELNVHNQNQNPYAPTGPDLKLGLGSGLDMDLQCVRDAVMAEQMWVKRKGNPSSYITAAFLEFVRKLDGYDNVGKDRLVVGRNGSNGVFKLDVSV
ncbi:unnamed protein product [Ambrosiozyma monospora]|uniref:Unnamed protein product n=1 Tax=Ambrosiozyma monospora TaxID=43982 RepID=A0ACB5T6X8_AMBMO|nr:unnamed protein product [Ambrosiozyma monospora]